jgi:hypothetical protein
MILEQIVCNFSIYSYPIVTPNNNILILNWLDRSKMACTKQAASCYETHKAKFYQPKPTPARLLTNAWKRNKKAYNITNPNSPDYTIANPPLNKFLRNTTTGGK